MRLLIPIIITLVVFSVAFNNQLEFTTLIDELSKEEKIISVDWQDTLNKFNKFAEECQNTFDSWKGEYNVDGEWQWYDYVGNFFTGLWNGIVGISNGIAQFGTAIALALFYCGVSLIDLINFILIGFKYLVGIKI